MVDCLRFLCFFQFMSRIAPNFLHICSRQIFKSKNRKSNKLHFQITVWWKLTPRTLVQRHQLSRESYDWVIRVDVDCSEFILIRRYICTAIYGVTPNRTYSDGYHHDNFKSYKVYMDYEMQKAN